MIVVVSLAMVVVVLGDEKQMENIVDSSDFM